jgi:hypothetical protein
MIAIPSDTSIRYNADIKTNVAWIHLTWKHVEERNWDLNWIIH